MMRKFKDGNFMWQLLLNSRLKLFMKSLKFKKFIQMKLLTERKNRKENPWKYNKKNIGSKLKI